MTTNIRLIPMPEATGFVPLGVLGYCLRRTDFLAPVFTELALPLKKIDHTANDKLLDVLVSILSGCRAIYQVNTRLRPDLAFWPKRGGGHNLPANPIWPERWMPFPKKQLSNYDAAVRCCFGAKAGR